MKSARLSVVSMTTAKKEPKLSRTHVLMGPLFLPSVGFAAGRPGMQPDSRCAIAPGGRPEERDRGFAKTFMDDFGSVRAPFGPVIGPNLGLGLSAGFSGDIAL